MKSIKLVSILFSVVFLFSCSEDQSKKTSLHRTNQNELSDENSYIVDIDSKKLDLYLNEKSSFILDFDSRSFGYANKNLESIRYGLKGDTIVYEESQANKQVTIDIHKKGEYQLSRKILFQDGTFSSDTFKINAHNRHPLIENDGITLGLLLVVLALIFWTYSMKTKFWSVFYKFIPALLLCYFVPALLNTFGIIDGENSRLYFVSSRFLLPASLVLLCISVDIKGILNLGPKALIMFFTATIGIVIGAPIALWLVSLIQPDVLGGGGPDALWRGLSTIAGSWIGGGANQAAMKEISEVPDVQFSLMILVDVFIANIWMAFLLFGAGKAKSLDKKLKADSSAIESLKSKIEKYQAGIARYISFNDLIFMAAVAFACTAVGHFAADMLAPVIDTKISSVLEENPDSIAKFFGSFGKKFFWLIIVATGLGVALSFTKAKKLEGAGASKVGSLFLYILVASIGMHIDFGKVIQEWQEIKYILAIGFVWMIIHITILLIMAKIIKAPFFFVAVGSQANIGGAASAPIVASAFSPALAPVGVLLAVLGYAIGTVGAIICMELMFAVS